MEAPSLILPFVRRRLFALVAGCLALASASIPARALVITAPGTPGNYVNGGASLYQSYNGSWQLNVGDTFGSTVRFEFPDKTRPAQPVRSFQTDALFFMDQARGAASYELAFNYGPPDQWSSEARITSNPQGGLVVAASNAGSANSITIQASWQGSRLGNPVSVSGDSVTLSVILDPQARLTIKASSGSNTSTLVDNAPISWTSGADWRFGFQGAPLAGINYVILGKVRIVADTAPYVTSAVTNRTSFQDFPDAFDLDLDTLEGRPEGVTVTATSSNPAVIDPTNLVITATSPTRRNVALVPKPGAYGDTTITLRLDPGAGGPVGTTSYVHSVAKNIPPSLESVPPITQPQGFTRVQTLQMGSAHWPTDRLVMSVDSFPTNLIDPRTLFLMPIDGTSSQLNLVFTPRPDVTGAGEIVVRATDPSGDSSTIRMAVTTVTGNQSPTVLGAGTAISFNTTTTFRQYAAEWGTSPGTGLGSTATVEAWVYPIELSDDNFNFVAHVGLPARTQGLVLALQRDGSPSFANYFNDFIPTNATRKVSLNQWHHLAAVLSGQSVSLYVDGQLSAKGTIPAPANITAGPIYLGHEPLGAGDRRLTGHLDEVRIWSVARSDDDIAYNHNRAVRSDAPGLLRYFRFDEGFVHFDGGPGGTPGSANYVAARLADSSVNQHPIIAAVFPSYVPGVPLALPVDVEQNQASTLGLATVVSGTNAWGSAGVVREIFFGPASTALGSGLGSSPGWPTLPIAVTANGVGVEVAPGGPNAYGQRIRGILLAPETGAYTFAIASAHEGQLFLGSDDSTSNLRQIAYSPATGISFRQFDAQPALQTAQVSLVAGQRYYFEVRHQAGPAGSGNPHLSVQWTLPNGTVESPIPAYRLQPVGAPPASPYTATAQLQPEWGTLTMGVDSATYRPLDNYFGSDEIAFQVRNGDAVMPPTVIELQVLNRNPLPVAGSGNAIELDGTTSGIQRAPGFDLTGRSFTVEVWARRADSTPGLQTLFSFLPDPATNRPHATFGWFDDGQIGLQMSATLPNAELLSSTNYLDMEWHHWAVVFDAATGFREIFRDGILLGSLVSTNVAVGTGNLHLGSIGGTQGFFAGSLDEFRLWTRARTREEILASMNTPLVGNETDLFLYYRFDEGNGLIAHDSSAPKPGGVRLDATLVNPVHWTNGPGYLGRVAVPRNSPGEKIFLPAYAFGDQPLTYQITGQPGNGNWTPDPLNPGVYSYTPQPGFYGTDTVRYTVTSGGLTSAEASLAIDVAFLPLPPTISAIRDQELEEEDPAVVLPFTVSDVDNPDGSRLTFTIRSSNPALLPVARITLGGSGTSRTVQLDPAEGEVGTSTVEIEVSNGALTAASAFTVRVNPRLAFAVVNAGDLTQQPSSFANALNASGQLVGYVAGIAAQTNSSGFFYSGFGANPTATVFQNLGGITGAALDLSASGLVVGAAADAQNALVAFRIDPRLDGRPTSLGTLPGGNLSVATAVNDTGLIVGYAQSADGSFRAFTSDGTSLVPLALAQGYTSMWATDLNGAGEIAGYATGPGGNTNGFLVAGGQTLDLGRPVGASHVVVTALSDQGLVVGRALYPTGATSRVVVYQDGAWTDLGDMLGGGVAEPSAVNRFGQIVGRALTTNGVWHAFLYTDGRGIDLNPRLGSADWTLIDARGINDLAQIAATGKRGDSPPQALVLFPATEIGRRVFRPEGTLGVLPNISVLQGTDSDNYANSFYWSSGERKLYAIRPVVASIGWRTGTYQTITNLTQFGDTYIRQVFTNEVLLQTLSFNIWPADPEIHVAHAPVQVEPDVPEFAHGFVDLIYTTADGATVDGASKVFNSPSPGYSVVHYLRNEGRPLNAELQPHHFTVARTIPWNDPAYLVTNTLWSVGAPITNALHQDYPGLNGFVLTTNGLFDGTGPDAAYSPATRLGPILPVNSNQRPEDFVVVWYGQDRIGTSWASRPQSYSLRWPTNAPTIVIASQLGSGPLAPSRFPQARIYHQPNPQLPGFNPNEEHALIAGGTLYALRNDLNGKLTPKASDPFVLLKYLDPEAAAWRMQVFGVVAEQHPYTFRYDGIAGREIQPPLPISLLPLLNDRNQLVSGPGWRDVQGRLYARAASPDGGEDDIVLRYFYPLQPEFFYDLDRDGKPDLEPGAAIPWLDRLGGTQDVPINVTYSIQWPVDAPSLQIGQSVTTPTRGLPDILDMAGAEVVFDSLDPTGSRPLNAGARLFDPLSPRAVELEEDFRFPDVVQRQTDPSTGYETFPDLPYHLRVRLYHDPQNHRLAFRGFVIVPSDGGASITLVNIMNQRERETILAIDSSANPDFAEAVESLFHLTRNPNRIDLTGDGLPDQSLLVGLTSQVTTNIGVAVTNVVRETLSGPKALTAGQPIPSVPSRSIPALRFGGGSDGMTVSNQYTGILDDFTVELWVRPEVARPETPEANVGVTGTSGQPFTLYPDHGTIVSGLPGRTGVGISVGTNGVSVFEHASDILCSPLVHSTTLAGWHHIAVVYRDARPELYIDGVLVRIGSRSSNRVMPSASLVHPNQPWGNYGTFQGSIGDVRLWDHSRSQLAIGANLNLRLRGDEPGLIGLWRFEERSGATAADSSPSLNPGALTGTPAWITEGPVAPPGPRYVVVAENNDPALAGLPVELHVIRLDDALAQGALALIQPDNVLDERVTLRHTADFAGQPESFAFQWFYKLDAQDFDPTLMPVVGDDGEITAVNDWIPFATDPEAGLGVNDLTLGLGSESSLLALSDAWYLMRYGYTDASGTTHWSTWIGDPAATAGAPRAMFVPGWIKRVRDGINLFSQRSTDFLDNAVNTLASTLAEAGPRYEGAVALNPSTLDAAGLIEIYSTVLEHGRNLSIDGNPPVAFEPADRALLLAAGSIADLYLLHANEAFADAADPTIGLTTDSTELGSIASSVFAFQNQADSLLDEELGLLRGRDDRSGGVGAAPAYNRLLWNFTGGDGEAAYVATYGIPDQNSDGVINAGDARILYPQGHGDAWGHYLTALTTYYDLLRHPNFIWIPRPEDALVAGVSVEVNFQDERRFARAAAARARAGAEVVDRTLRRGYTDDPMAVLQGYPDANLERAWDVSGWARRASQGAYFDWVTGNAILPSVDPNPAHTGIEKVDRTTVVELGQIVTEAATVVAVLDQANAGLNPLGLARGVVPFDLDPDRLHTGVLRVTHFEQVYERAVQSLRNAETTFNRATALSAQLRNQQNSVSDFSVAVATQEAAFLDDLIQIYGYPYAGDTGPGGIYPSGYTGPDLLHWMYVDTLDVTAANNPPSEDLRELKSVFLKIQADWAAEFSGETLAALDPTPTTETEDVEFPISASAYAFETPSSWGARRAEGGLQSGLRQLVLAQSQLRQASVAYGNLISELEEHADMLDLRYALRRDQLQLVTDKVISQSTFNGLILGAKTTKIVAEGVSQTILEAVDGLIEAIPDVEGLAVDALSGIAATAYLTGTFGKSVPQKVAEVAEIAEGVLDLAKEEADLGIELEAETKSQDFELTERLKDLEVLVRQEAALRLDLFNANQSVIQAARALESTLAQGQRLLVQRTAFRTAAAGTIQAGRYRDLGLRIFRNDALQKYEAQFELASRYVHLAAAAYDYELNLGGAGSAGSTLGAQIVAERNLGELIGGEPVVGRVGLASLLGRMRQNFDVLEGQLGLNNDRPERSRFSLRSEAFRILPTVSGTNVNAEAIASWRQLLQAAVVSNLWDVPEFRRYCRPFAPESDGPQPGLVLRFGTTIAAGRNFFDQPLGPLDSSYDPSEYATRIRSVAVWFADYDAPDLAAKPRVYLVPVGTDRLRHGDADDFGVRDWQVIDQRIPMPFPLGPADTTYPAGHPVYPGPGGAFAEIRRHSAFRAYQDATFDVNEFTESSRLVGRSVWNTQWVLIVPGSYLLGDPTEGLDRFVQTVDDIKLYFQTYSVSGN